VKGSKKGGILGANHGLLILHRVRLGFVGGGERSCPSVEEGQVSFGELNGWDKGLLVGTGHF